MHVPRERLADALALGVRCDREHPELALVGEADLAPRRTLAAQRHRAEHLAVVGRDGDPELGLVVAGLGVAQLLGVRRLGAAEQRLVRRERDLADRAA